ncbi:DUF397 domain-containing protein [Amycolatopsis sp. NPDC059021]|uniref:DUF397 domain-containing protein n=1 Tax=Amycolatopsis sp. NPDC059021 TaxID=3346704 RepID=UPI00366CA92F
MTPAQQARLTWRKSSYSNGGNGECVEVAWMKSSYSNGGTGECVEIAVLPARIAVRDSKAPASGALTFPSAAWHSFLSSVR